MNASRSESRLKSIFKAPIKHKKLLIVTVILVLIYTCTGKYITDNHFDYFVFSQRWLPTSCIEYIEHHSSSSDTHHCILPKNYASWAIHGLWPTQNKHMGPFFCNRSMTFDINKLLPIESELKLVWPNIEEGKGVSSLWQHEWEKHGTCAAQLESLNSEIKYFSTTLKFFKQFNVESILKKNNIVPRVDRGVRVTDVLNVVRNAFGKMPQVHCIQEVKTKRPFLSEIRLCYSKTLELMDCRSIHSHNNVHNAFTNCPLNTEIIYPQDSNVKLNKFSVENSSRTDFYDSLASILSIIRFLQWASI